MKMHILSQQHHRGRATTREVWVFGLVDTAQSPALGYMEVAQSPALGYCKTGNIGAPLNLAILALKI